MLSPLNNATYRRLFSAQVVVLGTGLATVAHGFRAHRLGVTSAGEILGIALAITWRQ